MSSWAPRWMRATLVLAALMLSSFVAGCGGYVARGYYPRAYYYDYGYDYGPYYYDYGYRYPRRGVPYHRGGLAPRRPIIAPPPGRVIVAPPQAPAGRVIVQPPR